jgi:hypothetical protein
MMARRVASCFAFGIIRALPVTTSENPGVVISFDFGGVRQTVAPVI